MKIIYLYLLVAFIFLSCFSSCKKEEFLSECSILVVGVLDFSNGDQNVKKTFKIDSNASWSVDMSLCSWCEVFPKSGSGNATVTLETKEKNLTTADRIGDIIIVCGDKKQTLTVRQPIYPDIQVDVNTINLADHKMGTSAILDIKSNIEWTASLISDLWCEISCTDGKGNGSLILTAKEKNLSDVERSTEIEIVGAGKKMKIKVNQPQGLDVYIAGYETKVVHSVAKYWKNGREIILGMDGYSSNAESIFVLGKDVYIVGNDYTDFGIMGKYWKNGVGTMFTERKKYSYPNDIFVSGEDVYIAGYVRKGSVDLAAVRYWKNGSEVMLSENVGATNSVFVLGSDVYVAGNEYNEKKKAVAKYWKNGVDFVLTNGVYDAGVSSIFISGADVYAAGYEDNELGIRIAKYWKNGIEVTLTNGVNNAYASSIFVSGTDVYVAGSEYDNYVSVARYWKNGVPTILTDASSTRSIGAGNSYAESIFVFGEDVYVVGDESLSAYKTVARYWKNGKRMTLTNDMYSSRAKSIVVVSRL